MTFDILAILQHSSEYFYHFNLSRLEYLNYHRYLLQIMERRFVRTLAAETLKAILSNQFILDVKKTNIYLMIVEIRQLWQIHSLTCHNFIQVSLPRYWIDYNNIFLKFCVVGWRPLKCWSPTGYLLILDAH